MKTNWTPRRNGEIYCSTACGHKCTIYEFDEAHKAADSAIKQLKTKGWVKRVYENLGWHWHLSNMLCGISLHWSNINKRYWCMVSDNLEIDVSHGSASIDYKGMYRNPNQAVAQAFGAASRYFEKKSKAFENLKKIKYL